MTISTRDQLISALGNNHSPILWDKASIASLTAGSYASLWRANGTPTQGAIPTTAAYCTKALAGSLDFVNQTGSNASYLAHHYLMCGNANTNFEIRDRIAHMGGLSGTSIASQSVSIDLSTINGGGVVASDRLGLSNYSEIAWFLEWYTATGITSVNSTINVTYNNGSSGNLAVVVIPSSQAASRCIQLLSASAGLSIRAVNTLQNNASTGSAGNFGVTAYKKIAGMSADTANLSKNFEWAELGLPKIGNDACLQGFMLCTTTSSGTIKGNGKIIHG